MTAFMLSSLRASIIAGAAALVTAAGILLAPGQSLAQSATVIVTANLNLRAGPGTQYPAIVVLPAGSQVRLFGCLSDYSWCDGDLQGRRGWLSARYLQVSSQGRYVSVADYARLVPFPVVAFELNAYWSSYYRNLPFYADRVRWESVGHSTGIQIGVFYNRLSPHGNWVSLRGQYVWVPRVDARWRPYADGHWIYARTYGWVWVSNEPFGWATYHYGRWGFSKRIGWFWIPGTRWAPAWVAWRGSGDYLAWAPLPPDPQDSFSISVSFGNLPNYYWQAVPATAFLSVNLSAQIVHDDAQLATVLQQTKPVGNVTIVNNVVVNNVVNVEFVEAKTKEKVVTHEVALTTDPAQSGKTQGETIEIFHPPAEETPAVNGNQFSTLVEALGGAQRILDVNHYKDSRASLCLVLPPVGSARSAILLLECIEQFIGSALFSNPEIQIQVCSPGRLSPHRSALLAIGFYLGSDTMRRYTLEDLTTSFVTHVQHPRGRRLVLYDADGDFDRNFDWWKGSDEHRLVEPRLPFNNGRSDLLTGSGSRLDIENINLLATLLVHAHYEGYWKKLGMQFEKEMGTLLEQHLLAGLVDAPWVRTDDAENGDDDKFFAALQELVAYAFEEAVRIKERGRFFWKRRDIPARSSGGILQEVQSLLQKYRGELVKGSRLFNQGAPT